MSTIRSVLIVGGGSAGLIAAITLRRRVPDVAVRILHSAEIGIIGVGEGTTTYVPEHLHGYCGIDMKEFYAEVKPSWKLGIRFLWGPRPAFNYTFTYVIRSNPLGLPRRAGHYAFDDMDAADVTSALMSAGRGCQRQVDGSPFVGRNMAYHLENETFVNYLERLAKAIGVEFIEGKIVDVERAGEDRVAAVTLENGQRLEADLWIDCSGFRSLLLGETLEEPFRGFEKTLFCDRAMVGGWAREDEPILPYTIAETMNAGWCWQIEHPQRINRGYVYSSSFLDDAAAETEFRAKCPKVKNTRVVKFRPGRYERAWAGNVVAMGNASGFVEPLEATSLGVICHEAQALAETLHDSERSPGASMRREFNHYSGALWDGIRRFLSIHYRFNTRLDTEFWQTCRREVELGDAMPIVEYYQENGPSILWQPTLVGQFDQFLLEGYYTLLIGQQVPHRGRCQPSSEELELWRAWQSHNRSQAEQSYSVAEGLEIVQSPYWNWNPDFYADCRPGGR